MAGQVGSPKNPRKAAFICHVVLAVIVAIGLAMQIHLWAIAATRDVVGAGVFMVVIYLGLPAMVAFFLALYYSWQANDLWLAWLMAALVAPGVGLFFDAPVILVFSLQVLYVVLVSAIGLLWKLSPANDRRATDERSR